ncbi:MAG: hypothetical protein JWN82_343 [Candidatus Saccharibacteria bacterium]|nr:hypothetical protein [Candidatus Saccharibacteria bacterium]
MALVTGVIVAAGYWYIMSATMNMALGQVKNYEQQYQQAAQLADQIATSDQSSKR